VEHAVDLVIAELNSYNHLVVGYGGARHPSTPFSSATPAIGRHPSPRVRPN
jgi:hypothetical protein